MESNAGPAPKHGRGLGGRAESTDGLVFAGLRGLAGHDFVPRTTGGVRERVELHVSDDGQLDPRTRGTTRQPAPAAAVA